MKLVYVSGPMTGIKNHNVYRFNRAERALHKKGYRVVNPIKLDFSCPQTEWKDCLRRDIKALMDCDLVVTLPDWDRSRGATLEVFVASQVGIPIKRLEEII
jgi:hypothetical protein